MCEAQWYYQTLIFQSPAHCKEVSCPFLRGSRLRRNKGSREYRLQRRNDLKERFIKPANHQTKVDHNLRTEDRTVESIPRESHDLIDGYKSANLQLSAIQLRGATTDGASFTHKSSEPLRKTSKISTEPFKSERSEYSQQGSSKSIDREFMNSNQHEGNRGDKFPQTGPQQSSQSQHDVASNSDRNVGNAATKNQQMAIEQARDRAQGRYDAQRKANEAAVEYAAAKARARHLADLRDGWLSAVKQGAGGVHKWRSNEPKHSACCDAATSQCGRICFDSENNKRGSPHADSTHSVSNPKEVNLTNTVAQEDPTDSVRETETVIDQPATTQGPTIYGDMESAGYALHQGMQGSRDTIKVASPEPHAKFSSLQERIHAFHASAMVSPTLQRIPQQSTRCSTHQDCASEQFCNIYNECMQETLCTRSPQDLGHMPQSGICPAELLSPDRESSTNIVHFQAQDMHIASVTRIHVCIADCVEGVTLEAADGNNNTMGRFEYCPNLETFRIPVGQHLSWVKSRVGESLSGIQFGTSQRVSSSWYGAWTGRLVSHKAKLGNEIWLLEGNERIRKCTPIKRVHEREKEPFSV